MTVHVSSLAHFPSHHDFCSITNQVV